MGKIENIIEFMSENEIDELSTRQEVGEYLIKVKIIKLVEVEEIEE